MDLCKICGANLAMVGRAHRCIPRNTPEASGTAREAPSGKAVGASAPMTNPSRNSVRASSSSQAKATKGKAGMAEVGESPLVRRSTAGTGLRVGEAVAVQPATSEIMDVTAGETAPKPKFDRNQAHREYMREYMRRRRQKEAKT